MGDASGVDDSVVPTTLGAEEVMQLWGLSRPTVYRCANDGTLPVAPLRIGRSLRWPTALVAASLGLDVAAVSRALSR